MPIELISCGPDALEEYEIGDLMKLEVSYTKFLYWYRTYPYEGDGYGIGFRADGLFDWWNLGHCSCYGPIEHLPDKADRGLTVSQIRELLPTLSEDDFDYDQKVALQKAFDKTQKNES